MPASTRSRTAAQQSLSPPERALQEYRLGGNRYDLLFGLREYESECEAPGSKWNSLPLVDQQRVILGFFHDRDGKEIELGCLTGKPLSSFTVAQALCFTEPAGTTGALMVVLDEELVLFVAHDTRDDHHPTLVLTCKRNQAFEEHAMEVEDERVRFLDENGVEDIDEEHFIRHAPPDSYRRRHRIPIDAAAMLPCKVGSIGGGGHHMGLAVYLNAFEPDADGLWNGQQVVAASALVWTDEYSPSENICLDPPVLKKRHNGKMLWCNETASLGSQHPSYLSDATNYEVCVNDVAVLPLEQMVNDRPGDMHIMDKLTEKEAKAVAYFRSLLLKLYGTIFDSFKRRRPIDVLPRVGALRFRRRYPILLLRSLLQRGRATIRDEKGARLKFIFAEATPDIFECILRQL